MMTIRFAERKDCRLILEFIKQLASYEKLSDQVVCDEKTLEVSIFDRKQAEVIFVCEDGQEVGFALFFHNFSTFMGKAGLYLEDLFVLPEYRGKGYGKALLSELASIALERDCPRFEWWCLDWNTSSIGFYKSIGAQAMTDWTVYRVTGRALEELSDDRL